MKALIKYRCFVLSVVAFVSVAHAEPREEVDCAVNDNIILAQCQMDSITRSFAESPLYQSAVATSILRLTPIEEELNNGVSILKEPACTVPIVVLSEGLEFKGSSNCLIEVKYEGKNQEPDRIEIHTLRIEAEGNLEPRYQMHNAEILSLKLSRVLKPETDLGPR